MQGIHKTIGEMINQISGIYPKNEALVHQERQIRYSYDAFLAEINRTAKGLIQMGLGKGDPVVLWAANIPEWILVQLALAKIGAVMVPVDPDIGKDDFGYIVEQSEPRAFIMTHGEIGEAYADRVLSVSGNVSCLKHIICFGETENPRIRRFSEVLTLGDSMDNQILHAREEDIHPTDPVAIMYTSGTTGNPKGVVLDHIGIINKSISSAERQGLLDPDRLCLFVPLFHLFGNTCIALTGLLKGGTIVIPADRFDAAKVLATIRQEKCTAIYGSPSMLITLLEHPGFKEVDWQGLDKGIIGGAPCPMDLMKHLVHDIGISNICVGYGITETSSWITMTIPDDPISLRVATIGTSLPCNEVKIVDPITGENQPPNGQGEICTRGFLMKGYHKMPAATANAIDCDGWFHSGDLGEEDDNGYIKITGRLKDVIVRDGKEIIPVELEEIIYEMPSIAEVQVFGIPDVHKGHEIVAWFKPKTGDALSISGVRAHCEKRLPVWQQPGFYKLVSEFPMTRSGKIQKYKLSDMARKELDREREMPTVKYDSI